jgi:hypothetical protein
MIEDLPDDFVYEPLGNYDEVLESLQSIFPELSSSDIFISEEEPVGLKNPSREVIEKLHAKFG